MIRLHLSVDALLLRMIIEPSNNELSFQIEGLGKKQLLETNNLVSCQVEGRRMQYLRCGHLWRNIGKTERTAYMVFIDLEKAYDRVPRQKVWRCMRKNGVTEKYVMIVQDMYEGVRTLVKSSVGLTDMIPVGVGLHQGSSLSPYLFAMIMDVLARGIKDISPWCMLYADDIVLCGTRSEVVEKKLEEWRRAMKRYR